MPAVISNGSSYPSYQKLMHFLDLRKTAVVAATNGCKMVTNTSIDSPKASYCIFPAEYDEFLSLYTKAVFIDGAFCALTEYIMDLEHTPLKIDMDFRYYANDLQRRYIIDDIVFICQLYARFLELYIELPCDEDRDFYILEKPSPSYYKDSRGNLREKDGLTFTKDGVHIVVPSIVINVPLQFLAREYVLKHCGQVLDKYKLENPYSDVFDRCVIDKNNWQMYGSTKSLDQPPYLVTHIYRIWSDRFELMPMNQTNEQLVMLLSIRHNKISTVVRDDKRQEVELQVDFYENKKRKTTTSVNGEAKRRMTVRKLGQNELKTVIRYLWCLKKERASTYRQWIELGWCLHNLHNKDDTLLQEWIKFSKQDPRYEHTAEHECTEIWEKAHHDGLSIGSLKLWAKQDNPEMYSEVVQTDIADHIMKACKHNRSAPYDVAVVMKAIYKDYFVCVSVTKSLWYYYDEVENIWKPDDRGIRLREKISTEVYLEFSKQQLKAQHRSLESDDQYAQESARIFAVMRQLKETSFKENIMKECMELFNDRDKQFINRLDSQNHLIGFGNGVYDLNNEEFRTGRPEDYISMSTKIHYVPYDPNCGIVQEIMEMYKTIFVVEKVRHWILKRSASFLSGSVKDELFDVYSGRGGNGKSKHIELLETCLGDYAGKIGIQNITTKRTAAGQATPEWAATKGKRLITTQEPDTKSKINVGQMKEVSGGDKIQARPLFKEPLEFKPQFKLVLCCNDKPELPSHDDGTWRRLRLVEFICKFTLEPREDKVLHFKINPELSENFENWAEPFMSILVHYYKIYRKEGIKAPDEIVEYSNSYREVNNHFNDFLQGSIEVVEGLNDVLPLDRILESYKAWYKAEYNDNKMKKRSELQTYLDSIQQGVHATMGNKKVYGYRGMRIKEDVVSGSELNNQCAIQDDDDGLT